MSERKYGTWYGMESAPLDKTPMLRPHVMWGAMAVIHIPEGIGREKFQWASSNYSPSWPDDAFLPFWMPLPDPPTQEPK